jgi:hypothetical protein
MISKPVFTTAGTVHPLTVLTDHGDIFLCTKAQYSRLYNYSEDATNEDLSLLEGNDDPLAVADGEVLYLTYNHNNLRVNSDPIGGTIHLIKDGERFIVMGGIKWGCMSAWLTTQSLVDKNKYHPPGKYIANVTFRLVELLKENGVKYDEDIGFDSILETAEEFGLGMDQTLLAMESPERKPLKDIVDDLTSWIITVESRWEKTNKNIAIPIEDILAFMQE